MILFSIIVPTYERTNDLKKCLDCIENGKQFGMICTPKDANYEIIVTDDGKNNETQLLISQHFNDVRWIKGPSKGPAANRNNGAKVAKGKWLVFTDDDCLPDSRWIYSFMQVLSKHENSKAFEGMIQPLGDLNHALAQCPVNLSGGCFWSANIVVQKKLFHQLGGFDENYPKAANEDQDLYLRLEDYTSIPFVPEAKVFHPVRILSITQTLCQTIWKSQSWAYYCTKHRFGYFNGRSFISPVREAFVYQFRNLVKFTIKRHFTEALLCFCSVIISITLFPFFLWHYKES